MDKTDSEFRLALHGVDERQHVLQRHVAFDRVGRRKDVTARLPRGQQAVDRPPVTGRLAHGNAPPAALQVFQQQRADRLPTIPAGLAGKIGQVIQLLLLAAVKTRLQPPHHEPPPDGQDRCRSKSAGQANFTSTAIINHSIGGLLSLCRPDARVMLLGPSTPLTPVLFKHGIFCLSGTRVLDEAEAITIALQDVEVARPQTHDLLKNMLKALSARLMRVEVVALKEDVYYGNLVVEANDRIINIDSRPSDALALAVRAHVPILIAREVMETAGVEPERDIQSQDTPAAPNAVPDSEERLSVFEDFLQNLSLDENPPEEDVEKPDEDEPKPDK